MIADDLRLPLRPEPKPDGVVGQSDGDLRVTPATVGSWRAFARYSVQNGQVTVGFDIFLDMLDQIERIQP